MSDHNADAMDITQPETGAAPATDSKGKGKAAPADQHAEDASMVDDDDDDEDEEEGDVSFAYIAATLCST